MSSFTAPLEYEITDKISDLGQPIYRVTKEFRYRFGNFDNPIAIFVVPVGTETDLATIPPGLRWLFKPDGPWVKAAVIHDFLWGKAQTWADYQVADTVFLEGLEVLKVNWWVRGTFYHVVRFVGKLKARK